MITNWSIETMERQPNNGLVTKIKWTVTCIEDMEFSNTNGIIELQKNDTFIPFDQLTEEIVLNWVWGQIDKDKIESELKVIVNDKINNKNNSTILTGLPW